MNADAGRRGACDRCRGQKLRCVGAANAIFNPASRFLRNEVPCDRCKRAKVECYNVRPAPKRKATLENSQENRSDLRWPQERAVFTALRHRETAAPHSTSQLAPGPDNSQIRSRRASTEHQRSNSVLAHNPYPSPQQLRDEDLPSALSSTAPNGWSAYANDDDMDWAEMDLETPAWMLDSASLPSGHDNADPSMMELISKPPSVDWSENQLANQASSVRTGPSSLGKPSGRGRKSSPVMPLQDTETKTCIQELARLNETLLREKTGLNDGSDEADGETTSPSIGHVLHHCREFISILQRLKRSCFRLDSGEGGTNSELAFARGASESSHRDASSLLTASKSSLAPCSLSTPPLEIPTLLSILSCYAYILQAYDHLLTPILECMTRSAPKAPATLSGLRLDGFDLDGDNVLQLECLTSVSFHMLDKIENILIGSPRQGGLFSQAMGGVLRDKLVAGWIDALYDQDDHSSLAHRGGKREVRAKRLIREIQAALKVVDL